MYVCMYACIFPYYRNYLMCMRTCVFPSNERVARCQCNLLVCLGCAQCLITIDCLNYPFKIIQDDNLHNLITDLCRLYPCILTHQKQINVQSFIRIQHKISLTSTAITLSKLLRPDDHGPGSPRTVDVSSPACLLLLQVRGWALLRHGVDVRSRRDIMVR